MSNEKACQFDCVVPLERPKAFALIVDHPALWWESPFAGKSGPVRECGIEPHPGGVCYEIGEDGKRRVWGTILSIEEPLYVRFAWQVSPDGEPIADPGASSRLTIEFRETGDKTRLELVHSEFLRHGEKADEYRDAMAASYGGWQQVLSRIVQAAARG